MEAPKAGRPMKFSDPAELEEKINAYFTECEEHWDSVIDYVAEKDEKNKEIIKAGKVKYKKVVRMVKRKAITPTITGLAVALETNRQVLLNYEDEEYLEGKEQLDASTRGELIDTIKRAKAAIEAYAESLLVNGGAHPVGVIFNLKNNWGWKDKFEVDNTIHEKPIMGGETAEAVKELMKEGIADVHKNNGLPENK